MERYKVSGDDLRRHYEKDVQLKDVFHDIEMELKAEQRVVCQFIVNDMVLEEKDESRFAGIHLSEVNSLEYVSEKTDSLLIDVMDGWLKAIPELQSASETFAAQIREGKANGLKKSLYDLVENCEFLVASLNSARGIMGEAVETSEFEPVERQTSKAIQEALRHLENQDLVQLGLVIEYDLNDSLEGWARLLKDFRQKLGHVQAAKESRNDDQSAHSMDRRPGSN